MHISLFQSLCVYRRFSFGSCVFWESHTYPKERKTQDKPNRSACFVTCPLRRLYFLYHTL